MAWAAGSFSRTNGVNTGSTVWQQDRDAAVNIVANRHDTHDQDLADGINACLHKGGQNTPTANLGMGGYRHTSVGDPSARNEYASVGKVQDGAFCGVADTGAADAYAIALSPAVTAYAAYQTFWFIAANANTGASTLNVNGLGAKAMKKHHDLALESGDIEAGQLVGVAYDGTNFQMISPVGYKVQQQSDYLDDILGTTPSLHSFLVGTGSGYSAVTSASAGTILGFPASSTDNALARYTGAAGKLQNSGWTLSDAGLLTAAGVLAMADNEVQRAKFKDFALTPQNIGDFGGGAQALDLENGNFFSATVSTSTVTFTFTNPPASGSVGSFALELTNGGSQTVNWPASVEWEEGVAPTLTTSGVDLLLFTTRDGGTTWRGVVLGLDFQ